MTDKKAVSRRKAIKLLGAATGVSLLAGLPSRWTRPVISGVVLPAHAQLSPVLPTVTSDSFTDQNAASLLMDFAGTVVDDGGAPVTARGFVFCQNVNRPPTVGAAGSTNIPVGSGVGPFASVGYNVGVAGPLYMRAYATNSVGTGYGAELTAENAVCLAVGTLVTLADGSLKKIEDIEYTDLLSVWNFDDGRFDTACPLWIKKAERTDRYNLLRFSDGTTLKTINQHRIFNKEVGAFTYPMTDDTPIGTTTFNISGEEVRLVDKRVVHESVNYYNVITHGHMNLFADGILTSCRYNNIYPIADMKFVKDDRELITRSAYGVEDRYYDGLRLAEQRIAIEDTVAYVSRLQALQTRGPIAVFHELDRHPVWTPAFLSRAAAFDTSAWHHSRP